MVLIEVILCYNSAKYEVIWASNLLVFPATLQLYYHLTFLS